MGLAVVAGLPAGPLWFEGSVTTFGFAVPPGAVGFDGVMLDPEPAEESREGAVAA